MSTPVESEDLEIEGFETVYLQSQLQNVAERYEEGDFAYVTRLAMDLADRVNQLWDSKKPWLLAKDESQRESLHAVCSDCLRSFYALMVYLTPILPEISEKAMALFGRNRAALFDDVRDLPDHIKPYEHLLTRLDPKLVEAMVEASKESLGSSTETAPAPAKKSREQNKPMSENAPAASEATTIGIDDFARLDLRIGKVTACEFVEGSDKLLRFELDGGPLGTRQIFLRYPRRLRRAGQAGRSQRGVHRQPRPTQDALRPVRRDDPLGRRRW